MGNLFNTLLVYPLLNILVFIYNYVPDIGAAIIILTVLVRLALLPSFHRSLKHQRALQALQPKMQEIREKYKDDQQQLAVATMELYKAHNVNPLSSCLPVLIQLPFLFALYQVFLTSLNGQGLEGLYPFVENPGGIDPMFLGLVNLAEKQNYVMAAIAAVLQFLQTKMMQGRSPAPSDQASQMVSKYMVYFLPVITFLFGVQFPAGLALYWIVTTLFGIGQQYFIIHKEAKEALYGKSQ